MRKRAKADARLWAPNNFFPWMIPVGRTTSLSIHDAKVRQTTHTLSRHEETSHLGTFVTHEEESRVEILTAWIPDLCSNNVYRQSSIPMQPRVFLPYSNNKYNCKHRNPQMLTSWTILATGEKTRKALTCPIAHIPAVLGQNLRAFHFHLLIFQPLRAKPASSPSEKKTGGKKRKQTTRGSNTQLPGYYNRIVNRVFSQRRTAVLCIHAEKPAKPCAHAPEPQTAKQCNNTQTQSTIMP